MRNDAKFAGKSGFYRPYRVFKLLNSASMIAMAFGSVSAIAGPGKVCLDGVTVLSNPAATCAAGTINTYYANSPQLRKFVDTLPRLGVANKFANGAPGEYIPVGVADTVSYPGSDYYIIGVMEHEQRMHSDLKKGTLLRSYVQLYPQGTTPPSSAVPLKRIDNITPVTWDGKPSGPQVYAYDKPRYLGPVIVANSGTPVRVKMVNLLPTGAATISNGVLKRNGDMFLPVDESLAGAGTADNTAAKYTQNRVGFHLHGGDSPWISDGTPHQWIAPVGETTKYMKGDRLTNVPDMVFPGDGAQTIYWPNDQSARLMWYHDHTFGLTRQNAYAGAAAGYVITDPVEKSMITNGVIPADSLVLVLQDKSFVPDDINVQDAKWRKDAWGQPGDLWYPHVYEPFQIWDKNAQSGAALSSYFTVTTTTTVMTTTTVTDAAGVSTTTTGSVVTPTSKTSFYSTAPVFSPTPSTSTTSSTNQLDSAGNLISNTTVVTVTDSITSVAPATGPEMIAAQFTANPAGRWDYATDVTGAYQPPPVQTHTDADYGVVAFPDGSYSDGSLNKGPSTVPEAYMDTPVVNGVAYPTLTVDPKAYRIRFLNGSNDRYWNLSLWVADDSVTSSDGRTSTEVRMITAPTQTVQYMLADKVSTVSLLADRPGGLPDPTTAGPNIIQFANEAGLLPNPVVHAPKPISGTVDALGNLTLVRGDDFYLGAAERADTVIDFAQYAGKTLILYNDSSAPVPGGDPRYDYYTGNPDLRVQGGSNTTLPGFGPNTRTVMQFVVASLPGNTAAPAAYDATGKGGPLELGLPAAYSTSADPHIADVVSAVPNVNLANNEITIGNSGPLPLLVKTIEGFTDPNFGRLIAQLGVELPNGPGGTVTTTPLAYVDKPTDLLEDGKTQYWLIKNNDGDNHPMHFHLFNVQVLARVDQTTGVVVAPQPDEMGWKETVKNWPGEDVIVAMKPKTPQLPFGVPNSVRLLDPTLPAGAASSTVLRPGNGAQFAFMQMDPNTGVAATVVNSMQDFGWEYVWHCHILGHEENDLMRPMVFHPIITAPAAPTNVAVSPTGTVTWIDPTPVGGVDANSRATKGNSANEIGFVVERVALKGGAVPTGAAYERFVSLPSLIDSRVSTLANATSYAGPAPLPNTDYLYQVAAVNEAKDSANPTKPAPLAYGTATLNQAPATPTGSKVTQGGGLANASSLDVILNWADNATNETDYIVTRSDGVTTPISFSAGADKTTFTDRILNPSLATTYSYTVTATNSVGKASSAAVTFKPVPALVAPALLKASFAATTATLTWTDQAFAETGYVVKRASGTVAPATGIVTWGTYAQRPTATTILAANASGLAADSVAVNSLYQYQVSAATSVTVGKTTTTTLGVPATVILATATALTGPTAVQANGASTASTIGLQWTNSSNKLTTGYEVQRCAGTVVACNLAGAIWVPATGTLTVGTSTSKYVSSGLTAKTTYTHRIAAISNVVPGATPLRSPWVISTGLKTL